MAKILVIDDENMIRVIAEKILVRDSHEVLTSETGSEAIALFQEHSDSIDLILVDMLLDDMNGFEILTEVRKINPNIPGIISSGNIYNEDDIPENIDNDIYFLQKPYKSKKLSGLVHSILVSV